MLSRSLSFPEDHKPHEAVIEWWYWNGHLSDGAGNKYSFMTCLFKADVDNVGIPYLKKLHLKHAGQKESYGYFAHSIVTDICSQKNYKDIQNISLVSNDSFSRERLFVEYINPVIINGFECSRMAEIAPDIFQVKMKNADLILKAQKPALLEGGTGVVTVSGREVNYYSLTDIDGLGFP